MLEVHFVQRLHRILIAFKIIIKAVVIHRIDRIHAGIQQHLRVFGLTHQRKHLIGMLGTLGKDNLQIGEGEIILIQIFAHQRKWPIHALFIQHRGVGIGLAAVLNGFANAAIADKGKRQLFSQRAGWQ